MLLSLLLALVRVIGGVHYSKDVLVAWAVSYTHLDVYNRQVLSFLSHREKEGKVTLIRDVEQELHIAKSVTSNLIKRMEKNSFIYLEPSPTDKRTKYVYLTDSVKNKLNDMKQFFDEVDQKMMAGVSEEELAIFFKVMHQFYENMKKRSEE